MSRWLQGIPSIAGSDLSSAPVTWMPFGKRVFTSAVEGEFKQSCVIFAFYFMSFAATIPDGCRSLVVFFHNVHHLNCIYGVLFGTQPMHMTFTFIALFLRKV